MRVKAKLYANIILHSVAGWFLSVYKKSILLVFWNFKREDLLYLLKYSMKPDRGCSIQIAKVTLSGRTRPSLIVYLANVKLIEDHFRLSLELGKTN